MSRRRPLPLIGWMRISWLYFAPLLSFLDYLVYKSVLYWYLLLFIVLIFIFCSLMGAKCSAVDLGNLIG